MRDARKYHNDMSYHYVRIFRVAKAKKADHDNSCQDSRAPGCVITYCKAMLISPIVIEGFFFL